jgi:hypothetical protein
MVHDRALRGKILLAPPEALGGPFPWYLRALGPLAGDLHWVIVK